MKLLLTFALGLLCSCHRPAAVGLTEADKHLYFTDAQGNKILISTDFNGSFGLGIYGLGDWRPQLSMDRHYVAFLTTDGTLVVSRTDGSESIEVSPATEHDGDLTIPNVIGGWSSDNKLLYARLPQHAIEPLPGTKRSRRVVREQYFSFDLESKERKELSSKKDYMAAFVWEKMSERGGRRPESCGNCRSLWLSS